ncbi:unnamed protein product [Effrenium voratum]|nr:unnamed protein product [Effrenium voratum]
MPHLPLERQAHDVHLVGTPHRPVPAELGAHEHELLKLWKAIAEALKINRTIVLIELDLNDIADAGAEALRKVVAEKKAQGLDLEIKL